MRKACVRTMEIKSTGATSKRNQTTRVHTPENGINRCVRQAQSNHVYAHDRRMNRRAQQTQAHKPKAANRLKDPRAGFSKAESE